MRKCSLSLLLLFFILVPSVPGASSPPREGNATIRVPAHPVINEVLPNAHRDWDGSGEGDYTDEWIELYNPAGEEINLSGLILTDRSGSPRYHLSGVMPPGGYLLLFRRETGIVLGSSDEVRLLDENGTLLDIATFSFSFYDVSLARRPNGVGDFYIDGEPTPGEANNPPPRLVINEVMVDPPGSNTGNQWIEIFNPGPDTNMTGMKLSNSEGFYYYFPPIHFPAGSYAVLYLKRGSDREDPYCYRLFTPSEFWVFATGDNLLLETYRGHPLDYMAWGLSTHIDPPPSLDGTPIWNGTYYNRSSSSYQGGMENPRPLTGRTLSRIPNGVDTNSPLDWSVVPQENITEGWNNSEPLLLEVNSPGELRTNLSQPVEMNITLRNLGPSTLSLNFTLHTAPSGWILPQIPQVTLTPGEVLHLKNLTVMPPGGAGGELAGEAIYLISEGLGRREWSFSIRLTVNLPDLSVEGIYFEPYHGGEYYPGERVEVSARVYNRGVLTARGVEVRGYVEWEGGSYLFMEREYESLEAGRYRIPSGELETYNLSGELRVVVEAHITSGPSLELSSTNNVASRNITVILPPPPGEKARLLITEVQINVSFPLQYIKVYNPAGRPLSVEDILFECSGVEAAFPGGSVIPPCSNITVAYDATEYRRAHGEWPDYYQREGDEEVPASLKGRRMVTGYSYLRMYSTGGELILRTKYYQRIDTVVWGGGEVVRGWEGEPVPLPARGWPLKRLGWPPEDTNTSADFLPPLPEARIVAVAPCDPPGYRAEYVAIEVSSTLKTPLLLTDGEGEVMLEEESWEGGIYVETLNSTSYTALTSLKPDFSIEGWGGCVRRAQLLWGDFLLANSGDGVILMDVFHRRLSEVTWGEGGVEPPGRLEALYVDGEGGVLRGIASSTLPWAFARGGSTPQTLRQYRWGLPPGEVEGSSLTLLSAHLLSWNISWVLQGGWREVIAVVDEPSLIYLTGEERTRLYQNLLKILERGGEVLLKEALDPPTPLPFQMMVVDGEVYLIYPLPHPAGGFYMIGPLTLKDLHPRFNITETLGLMVSVNGTALGDVISPLQRTPSPPPAASKLTDALRDCSISFRLFRPPLGVEGELGEVLTPPGMGEGELLALSGKLKEGARVLIDPSGVPTLNPSSLLNTIPGSALLSPRVMGRTPLTYLGGVSGELLYSPRADSLVGASLVLNLPEGEGFREIFGELWEMRIAPLQSPAPLLLDRIYYNTATYGEEDEFVGIYNPSSTPVDLSGYLLTDWEGQDENPTDGGILLPPHLVVEPHSYIYLSRSGIYFDLYWGEDPSLNYTWDYKTLFGDMRLANGGDSLTLISPRGEIVDRVVWGEINVSGGWVGPPLPAFSSPKMLQRCRDEDLMPVDTDRWQDFDIFSSPSPGRSYFSPSIFNSSEGYLYVSPEGTLEAFRRAVELARQEILIEVYTISSPEAYQALKGALMRGVNVTLLVEGAPVGGISTNEKWVLKELYQDGARVYLLERSTPEVFTERYRYVHAKYMVVDSSWLLIQSENLGDSALTPPNSSGNRGWGALLRSEELAGYFREVFFRDLSGRYDVTPYSEAEESIKPPENYSPPVNLGDGLYADRFLPAYINEGFSVESVLAPDYSVNALVGAIESAREEILIELLDMDIVFTYGGGEWWINTSREESLYLQCTQDYWEVNPLLQALIDAARRGVEVRLLFDSTDFNGDGRPENAPTVRDINTLASLLNLPTLRARLNWGGSETSESVMKVLHNKGMIIDSERVLISSINWGQNSLGNNREAGVIISSPLAASYYRRAFLWDWNQSYLKDLEVRVLPGRFIKAPEGEDVNLILSLYNWGLEPLNISLKTPAGGNLNTPWQNLTLMPGETVLVEVNITAGTPGDQRVVMGGEVCGVGVEVAVVHISVYEARGVERVGGEGAGAAPVLYLVIVVLSAALIFDLLQRLFERRGEGGGEE